MERRRKQASEYFLSTLLLCQHLFFRVLVSANSGDIGNYLGVKSSDVKKWFKSLKTEEPVSMVPDPHSRCQDYKPLACGDDNLLAG